MLASDSRPFEQLVAIDKIVHEPARLAILTALSACVAADFVFLQQLTGLQPGNLSQHLAKLEQAGFVELAKGFSGKYPQTTASITDAGRSAVSEHWKRLDAMKQAVRSWPRKRAARSRVGDGVPDVTEQRALCARCLIAYRGP